MIIDLKYFEHLVNTLETEHNIVREHKDRLRMTEAWMYITDQLLKQCKMMIREEKFMEEQNALYTKLSEDSELQLSDDELIELIETNYQKYATKEQTGE